jgi:hypothetical protein
MPSIRSDATALSSRSGALFGAARRVFALAALCGLFWLVCAQARAENFYDQPPMTEAELLRFIKDLPLYRAWARQAKELAHPGMGEDGRPTFVYSATAAARVKSFGWTPKRFFCVMGRAAAALAMQEEGVPGAANAANAERPVDMPPVSPAEFDLVRRHSAALIKAGDTP